jgi:regulator of cell morphogenesis and NO signaling
VQPKASIVARIVEGHHAYERRALPYITALLPKIVGRFAKRSAQLDALCDAGQDLAEALETYMDEEERTLLPALASGACDAVRDEMRRHDGELRALLSQVRSLAKGFVAPDWGDQSYRALMEELEALEEDVMDRLHVEEHVLLPPTR